MQLLRIIFLLLLTILMACSPSNNATQASSANSDAAASAPTPLSLFAEPSASALPPSAERHSDPFAYCAAVITIDAPDERFIGEPVPDVILQGIHRAAGGQGDPEEQLANMMHWRCMEGKVYACSVGANLPCVQKADPSQVPTSSMEEFCRANPQYEVVNANNSIYTWTCIDGTLQRGRQWTEVDAAGFLAKIWYEINKA